MAQEKTPGVYIKEKPAFPNSVVEVATGVPAFFGYTEKAMDGTTPLAGIPKRITSMAEYESFFGNAPKRQFTRTVADDGTVTFQTKGQDFFLYNSLQLYFSNGGGPCWIVSVGTFAADQHSKADWTEDIWKTAAKVQEPSMYVIPDAVALTQDDYFGLSTEMIAKCKDSMDRVALLDIYNGWSDRIDQVIDGPDGFREKVAVGDDPSYGIAYYPWLNTSVIDAVSVTFMWLDPDSRGALADEVKTELQKNAPNAATLADKLKSDPTDDKDEMKTHNALIAVSDVYGQAMKGLLKALNVLPPAAAMAGIFARTDEARGVFKAPANTGVMAVLSPTVAISDAQQEGLNVPLFGQAVNAIRSFTGRGVLVWGARTLDGNSQDYRYVNVRRTLIMLEQSIFFAAQAYVFEPNVAGTWTAVKTMIENFLNNQWKAGALAGSTPKDAYDVSVGLGTTMTGVDVLDGYMRITVRVAITRPAEFIVITFQQKMQTS